jgi:hypothetical protein
MPSITQDRHSIIKWQSVDWIMQGSIVIVGLDLLVAENSFGMHFHARPDFLFSKCRSILAIFPQLLFRL